MINIEIQNIRKVQINGRNVQPKFCAIRSLLVISCENTVCVEEYSVTHMFEIQSHRHLIVLAPHSLQQVIALPHP